MPENFAVRLTADRARIVKVLCEWSKVCDKVLAYEHSETGKIHSHLLLVGCVQSTENLRNLSRKSGLSLSGNGEWSFKTSYKDKSSKRVIPVNENTWPKYITYMSKGRYDAYYNKGFEETCLAELKAAWVPPDPNKSKDAVIFEDFAKVMNVDKQDYTYAQVWAMARTWSINRHGVIVNAKSLTEARMLANTYCWREEITIPWDKIKTY